MAPSRTEARLLCAVAAMAVVGLPGVCLGAGPETVELRVLTDRTETTLAPLLAAFEKTARVTVKAVYLDKGLISRLESRPTEADVVITKDAELLEIAKAKGLLQPFASARIRQAVPALFRDPSDMYFTDSYRARVIFYAPDRVPVGELSTYEALADPKWKGRICIRSGYHDYNLSLISQMLVATGPDRTRRFVEGLAANLARTPTGDDRGQARAIFEHKCDVAIANSYYMGIMLASPDQRSWGLATRVFFPDQQQGGSYILRSGLALTTARAKVKAATALLEFMVEEETQRQIAGFTFAYPVRAALPLPDVNRQLGQGQPGVKDGAFRFRTIPLPDMIRQREAAIRLLDETRFDRPR